METQKSSSIGIPGAIIIAAAILAVAIIWSQKKSVIDTHTPLQANVKDGADNASSMLPVSANDHILGNPNAQIKIVEYSDPSCPYCKLFNPTMERIMNEYGPGGKVAWIYRQFPLDRPDANGNILHPNSGRQAQALECAAGLGGNTKFWEYEKKWFEVYPTEGANRPVAEDNAQLASVAKSVGLDPVSFNECIASGRFKDKLDQSYLDGINAGVSGTPFILIIPKTGSKVTLVGSQPYEVIKSTIDGLITN